MKRVSYASSTFVTTDEIAAELVRFAVELANRDEADSVEVPGLTPRGEHSRFTLVIGPASQIVVDDITDDFSLDADAAGEALRDQRIRSGNPPNATGGYDENLWDTRFDDL